MLLQCNFAISSPIVILDQNLMLYLNSIVKVGIKHEEHVVGENWKTKIEIQLESNKNLNNTRSKLLS